MTVGLVSAMFKVRDSGKCLKECKKAEKPFEGFDCKTACFIREAMEQSGGGGHGAGKCGEHSHMGGNGRRFCHGKNTKTDPWCKFWEPNTPNTC